MPLGKNKEKHHKSSRKDHEEEKTKDKSSHKRKHKDRREDKEERNEKKLKLDIPAAPKEVCEYINVYQYEDHSAVPNSFSFLIACFENKARI